MLWLLAAKPLIFLVVVTTTRNHNLALCCGCGSELSRELPTTIKPEEELLIGMTNLLA